MDEKSQYYGSSSNSDEEFLKIVDKVFSQEYGYINGFERDLNYPTNGNKLFKYDIPVDNYCLKIMKGESSARLSPVNIVKENIETEAGHSEKYNFSEVDELLHFLQRVKLIEKDEKLLHHYKTLLFGNCYYQSLEFILSSNFLDKDKYRNDVDKFLLQIRPALKYCIKVSFKEGYFEKDKLNLPFHHYSLRGVLEAIYKQKGLNKLFIDEIIDLAESIEYAENYFLKKHLSNEEIILKGKPDHLRADNCLRRMEKVIDSILHSKNFK